MQPQVDNIATAECSSVWIDYAGYSARHPHWRTHMRTTMMALLCSLAACAPVGGGGSNYSGDGPDAGTDAGTVNGPCNDIEELDADLSIAGASGFANLPGTCWKLNGKLTISGPAVTSLAKLGDLRSVTDLELNNTDLTTFDSKANVEVTGELWIRYNEKLTDLGKVIPKGTVQAITIEHNPELTSIGGAAKATIVAGVTTIVNNTKLTTINLGAAQRLEGGLVVRDNPVATSLDIHTLQSAGSVAIANNAALTTINVTTLLANIHGALTIDNNDSLITLGSFGNALIVDTNVLVTGNAKLADIGQLGRAKHVFGIVQISSNAALDPTRANDIACCVPTSGYTSLGNKAANCTGTHWCLDTQNDCLRHQ